MNRCPKKKELSALLDNQLPQAQKIKIEEHIKSCPLCAKEFEYLKALSCKIKEWQLPELGESFDAKLRERIVLEGLKESEVKMNKKTLWFLVPSSALAGILVLVFVVKFYNYLTPQNLRISPESVGVLQSKQAYDSLGEQYEPYYDYDANINKKVRNIGVMKEAVYDRRSTLAGQMKGDRGKTLAAEQATYGTHADLSGYVKKEVSTRGESYEGKYITSGISPVIVVQPVIPGTAEGEKVIRNATVNLEVDNGQDTYNKVVVICQELGGYLSGSNFYRDKQNRESGSLTLRIPKKNFDTCIERLSNLGKVKGMNTYSQDVAQEYANLNSQLNTAMIVYNKMLEAMQKRQVSAEEAYRLESELTPIVNKIQGLKNRIEYLDNAVSFTTINLNFHEAEVSVKTLKGSSDFIKQNLITMGINIIKLLAVVIPFAIVGAVCLILIAVLGVIFYFVWRLFKHK